MSIAQTDGDDTLLREGQAAASGAALAGGVWKSPLTPTDEQVADVFGPISHRVGTLLASVRYRWFQVSLCAPR